MATAPRDYNHGFLPQADAIAYGMTTALRRGFNGKQPRARTIALSATICTRADGTQYVIEPGTRKSGSTNKRKSATVYTPAIQTRSTRTLFSSY